MRLGTFLEIYNFVWSLESHAQQRLAWRDAEAARIARVRAEAQSAAQVRAMLLANPSGQLGSAQLNDPTNLSESGLL
jgi:hypothetical protein